ncbi:MAG: hypothetical protein HY904_20220 [Deltaproteobacteria bacterium]|nr:hypothetical protein [Deltaproteobacteria bacterium]
METVRLEDLLQRDIRGGEVGGYGLRLAEQGLVVELHGFVTAEATADFADVGTRTLALAQPAPWSERQKQLGGSSHFELHHATTILRASVLDRFYPEFAVEWEHSGFEVYVPWGYVDMKAWDWLVVRAGLFPVPIGAFNEYLYPDFLRRTAAAPLVTRVVIPSIWSESGVQVRGHFPLVSGVDVNYAAYVVNGLEQADKRLDQGEQDSVVAEGGAIRSMRGNHFDRNHPDKAVGGRLGVGLPRGLALGVSAYTGAYTVNARRRLTLLDGDLTLQNGPVTFRAEAALAHQEVSGLLGPGPLFNALVSGGAYALFAYRIRPALEPYTQVDVVTRVSTRSRGADFWRGVPGASQFRLLSGVVLYPLPVKAPRTMLKLEGATALDDQGRLDLGLFAQAAVGF